MQGGSSDNARSLHGCFHMPSTMILSSAIALRLHVIAILVRPCSPAQDVIFEDSSYGPLPC